MRIIAFINEAPMIREIIGRPGEPGSAPRLAPARSSPWWELPMDDQAKQEIDPLAQSPSDCEFDQRIA